VVKIFQGSVVTHITLGVLTILRLHISYSIYVLTIMKIGWL